VNAAADSAQRKQSLGSHEPSPVATPHARTPVPRGPWAAGWFTGALLLTAAAAVGGGACSQPRTDGPKSAGDAPEGMLAVGAAAPDLVGKDAKGQPVRLHERQGHVSIVYFYPKDGTPGCTKEACAFRDTFDKFVQRDVTIFGVSRDDEASHAKFRAEHSLPFPLVADPDAKFQKAYGVPDKFPGLAARVTFLVAADGRIAKIWPDVDPAVHADEVFAAIEQLK
jgi:thioredoxin-dependent peroxiredoxin